MSHKEALPSTVPEALDDRNLGTTSDEAIAEYLDVTATHHHPKAGILSNFDREVFAEAARRLRAAQGVERPSGAIEGWVYPGDDNWVVTREPWAGDVRCTLIIHGATVGQERANG